MAHPPRFADDDPLLLRLRAVALSLPGAAEKISHGRPTFFTRKIFAIYGGVTKGEHSVAELVEESFRQTAPVSRILELDEHG